MWKYQKYLDKEFIDKFTQDLTDDLYNKKDIKSIQSKYSQRLKRKIDVLFSLELITKNPKVKLSGKKEYFNKVLKIARRKYIGDACYDWDKKICIQITYFGYLAMKHKVDKEMFRAMLHDTFVHELTHAFQHKSRKVSLRLSGDLGDFDERTDPKVDKKWKAYLSDQAELEAWAAGMAAFLEKRYKNKGIAYRAISSGKVAKFPVRWNFILNKYANMNKKVFNEFLYHVYTYLYS